MGENTGIDSSLPGYLQKVPWFYNTGKSGKHLEAAPFAHKPVSSINDISKYSKSKDLTVFKWKPGSCKNCGSDTHTESQCPERPRKKNARVTGTSVGVREIDEVKDLSYEAKRDGWASVSNSRWKLEVAPRFRQQDKMRAVHAGESGFNRNMDEKFGHTGFRDREDVPEYLMNPGGAATEGLTGNGNFIQSTDAPTSESTHKPKMAWEYGAKPIKIVTSNTDMIENREFIERKAKLEKGFTIEEPEEEFIPKSTKYEEDIFVNGHSAVWGSYFHNGLWGYACCKQTEKRSKCIKPIQN